MSFSSLDEHGFPRRSSQHENDMMAGPAALPLDPIHDALEKLRFRTEAEQHRLAVERGWEIGKDARVSAVGKFFNVVAGAELGIVITGDLLKDQWWHEHSQDGTSPDQKQKVAFEFQNWIKVGFVTFINAAIESSFRNLLRAVDPAVANSATAEWKSIYTALLKRVSISSIEPEALLDLLRTIRNTIHNNGVYLSPRGTDRTVTYQGHEFEFIHGHAVSFATWDLLLQLGADVFDLLLAVVESPEIAGLVGTVRSEYS
jgi:hypothetical protein